MLFVGGATECVADGRFQNPSQVSLFDINPKRYFGHLEFEDVYRGRTDCFPYSRRTSGLFSTILYQAWCGARESRVRFHV